MLFYKYIYKKKSFKRASQPNINVLKPNVENSNNEKISHFKICKIDNCGKRKRNIVTVHLIYLQKQV